MWVLKDIKPNSMLPELGKPSGSQGREWGAPGLQGRVVGEALTFSRWEL